ncbi:MAG: hypothetical protein J1F67_06110 [Muribaculaceae bacterium]|nr:hypothetical protein [Muribaculaceae bacterium]
MNRNLIYILCLLFLIGCGKESNNIPDSSNDSIESIAAYFEPLKSVDFITTRNGDEIDEEENANNFEVPPILNDKFVDKKSIIYISQLGPDKNPQFTNFSPEANPYCCKYIYYENNDATWDYEYNFKVADDSSSITWTKVKQVGSYQNSFSLFSLYFPIDNKVKFYVEKDQSGGEEYDTSNFLKSDIMGAYHATSSLFTRLRFRFFHLMVYLKITLYVPIYKDETDDEESKYSGYDEGSLLGGYVMNAHTNFNIEWRANKSSDTEALATYVTDDKDDIAMYLHPYDDKEVRKLENIKDFYSDFKGTENYDEVRVYNFSVLFPAQTFGDNYLCFGLRDIEKNNRYYYFSGSQVNGESGNLTLTPGTLQQLYLYLPRKSNETILVAAKILPWKDSVTDMTVTKDDPKP